MGLKTDRTPTPLANLKVRPETLRQIKFECVSRRKTQAQLTQLMFDFFQEHFDARTEVMRRHGSVTTIKDGLVADEREARLIMALRKMSRDPRLNTVSAMIHAAIERLVSPWDGDSNGEPDAEQRSA